MRVRLLIFSLALYSGLSATHLRPWLGEELLPFFDTTYAYQEFHRVRIKNKTAPFCSDSHFLDFGAYGAYAPYSIEAETGFAGTQDHHFNWEDFRLTGRYQVLDDISGQDPVSAVVGMTVSRTSRRYVEDISTFHHGRWEYLFHASVGKERPCGPTWGSRAWAVAGMGTADEGSVWFFGHVEAERNRCDRYWYGAFLEGLFGLGDQPLSLVNFTGYGPVQHRSIDLGGHFNISFWEYGYLTARYSYRVWAYNFPAFTNLLILRYEYPFGL